MQSMKGEHHYLVVGLGMQMMRTCQQQIPSFSQMLHDRSCGIQMP